MYNNATGTHMTGENAKRANGARVPHRGQAVAENQVPSLLDVNLYTTNHILRAAVRAKLNNSTARNDDHLVQFGQYAGSRTAQAAGIIINRNGPQFTPFDRFGNRIDSVTFDPLYHAVLGHGQEVGIGGLAWSAVRKKYLRDGPEPSAANANTTNHIERSILMYLSAHVDGGTGCPLSMTHSCFPSLEIGFKTAVSKQHRDILREFLLKASVVGAYDSRDVHVSMKRAAQVGMSMTEKQGGSDVRANLTWARPHPDEAQQSNGAYLLNGHKWFTSAPMCDAFLVLAKVGTDLDARDGVTCFLVPRWVAPGQRNAGLRFQRLKEKVGDRSNASSEVEYHDAVGYIVGPPGGGVATIIEMVSCTRLDCILGSAGLMHSAVVHAVHHARHRRAFGATLINHPLMQSCLADLAMESEAATAAAMRVAWAMDNKSVDVDEALYCRIALPLLKYHVCKMGPQHVYECMECLGGNGYTEEFRLATLYRQAPLNAIWEGSGNVIVLDVFRALKKANVADLQRLFSKELSALQGVVPTIASEASELLAKLQSFTPDVVVSGRWYVERLAVLLQAAAMNRFHDDTTGPKLAALFLASRSGDRGSIARGRHFGSLRVTDSNGAADVASRLVAGLLKRAALPSIEFQKGNKTPLATTAEFPRYLALNSHL